MKQLKWLIGAFFAIGMPFPVLLTDHPHQWWFAFVALANAFIGAGIMCGFSGYKVGPKKIGNDGVMPVINQVWMMFFIAAVANLFWANLYID
jgi:hypothetical protein